MAFEEQSIREFTAALASAAPVPGGGGAAALVGALAAALGQMVANLTIGKARYAQNEERVIELKNKLALAQRELLRLIERDAELFEPLVNAYNLPAATEAERADKAAVMEKALAEAAEPPLDILRLSAGLAGPLEEMAELGSRLALSDVGVAAVFASAAVRAAALNVRVNTRLMKDRAIADALDQEAERELERALQRMEALYKAIIEKLEWRP